MATITSRRVMFRNEYPKTREERLAMNNRFAQLDTSDEEDEEDHEEEEQERILSIANGEASEASSDTKRKQTDKEIEAEYSSTKRRKLRPTLKPSHLIGSDGLVKIRTEFPSILPKCKNKSVDSAASYTRLLRKAYQNWAYQLFPGLALEDVLSRVETFGSKREVKGYVQTMREAIRNEYLQQIMGKETAEKMIEELVTGLQQQRVQDEINKDNYELYEANQISDIHVNQTMTTSVATNIIPNPAIAAQSKVDSDSEEEFEFTHAMKSLTPGKSSELIDTDDEVDKKSDGEKSNNVSMIGNSAKICDKNKALELIESDDEGDENSGEEKSTYTGLTENAEETGNEDNSSELIDTDDEGNDTVGVKKSKDFGMARDSKVTKNNDISSELVDTDSEGDEKSGEEKSNNSGMAFNKEESGDETRSLQVVSTSKGNNKSAKESREDVGIIGKTGKIGTDLGEIAELSSSGTQTTLLASYTENSLNTSNENYTGRTGETDLQE